MHACNAVTVLYCMFSMKIIPLFKQLNLDSVKTVQLLGENLIVQTEVTVENRRHVPYMY